VDKDSTLPPTITVECQCPSAEEAGEIKQAIGQETIPGVDGQVRVAAGANENESGAVQLSVNWKPAGRFEPSARAITAWLESRKCSDFAYRLESGWHLPAAE
jgi:hypothetical protein